MSSVTGIRLESLLHSLKELQNEKNFLEQRFNEKKAQSKGLEKRVEQCNLKLLQVKEMYQKMLETQKVSQQKVAQVQAQVDCMHESNSIYGDKMKELNAKIKEEKERASKNVQDFDKHMSALADSLVSARKFYTSRMFEDAGDKIRITKPQCIDQTCAISYKEEVLQERIQEIRRILKINSQADEINKEEANMLAKTMEGLQLNPAGHYYQGDDVPYEERLLLWKLLEHEERQVSLCLQTLQAERQTLRNLLQASDTEQDTSTSCVLQALPAQG